MSLEAVNEIAPDQFRLSRLNLPAMHIRVEIIAAKRNLNAPYFKDPRS
jgi:hypothetical protein